MVKDARRLQLKLGDGIWLRLVDVGEALARRSYEGDDSVVLEVTDEFCPWNEGATAPARTPGPTEDAAELRLVGCRSRLRVPGRVLVRAARCRRQRWKSSRRRDRARHCALQDAAAAVLPRAVLVAIKVRTCKTLAEFKQAAGAIAEYGGWDAEDEREAVPALHPLDHARCLRRPERRRRRRRLPVRHVGAGRLGRVRRRHRRRRLPDAPPPRGSHAR